MATVNRISRCRIASRGLELARHFQLSERERHTHKRAQVKAESMAITHQTCPLTYVAHRVECCQRLRLKSSRMDWVPRDLHLAAYCR